MSGQGTSPELEVLAGLVEPVTLQNAQNGFCVLRAKPIALPAIRGIGV